MTTTALLNAAETWERVYTAFEQVNFTAYDYDSVKQSLLDYLKLQYPENFNDYIESAQLVAIIETFSYVAELLSYRVDLSIHESLMPTATRKQSILRLAKLISYTASRNLPLRGLVKIISVSTSENITDSQGNSLANRVITWGDQNNSLWREQFFTVMDKILTQSYSNPFKSFQIDDTVFQQYEIANLLETTNSGSSFQNGVIKTSVSVSGQDLGFELVPSDVDQNGVFERDPNPNAYFTLLYADDGYGDESDTTGFMMYLKQGVLQKLPYVFDINLPNQTIDVSVPNINDSDVWVQNVDQNGVIQSTWQAVPNVAGVNLIFNSVQNMNKYEIETLENDQIRLIFGDGDFAAMPSGIFNIWVRASTSGGLTVPKNLIVDQPMTFGYTSKTGQQESATFTYSLASALQNSANSEDTNHIKSTAPSVYYSQNRMVNGQDYNSYLLQDQSILRLNAVNRTFAGQPKYIDWNDASGAYQNIKIFGDDLRMYYDMTAAADVSTVSSRSLIDDVLEPDLSLPGIYNMLIFAFYTSLQYPIIVNKISGPVTVVVRPYVKPRTKFIEDAIQGLFEKTLIQGYLDRHWYGEPDVIVQLDSNLSDTSPLPKSSYAVVNGDADHLIWNSTIKCVRQDPVTGLYTLIPTPGGISGIQETVIRQKRFGIRFNPMRSNSSTVSFSLNGPIITLAAITAHGSGYTPGTYTNVPLIYVTPPVVGGTGAVATIVVNIDGTIHAGGVTITAAGNDYLSGDILTATPLTGVFSTTGNGTSFSVSVATTTSVVQALMTKDDIYTIEITDTSGTFTVHSANLGYQPPGICGTPYSNGIFSFTITLSAPQAIIGDAFIVSINLDNTGNYTPQTPIKMNLTGTFNLIDDATLSSVDAINLDYDVTDPIASWIIIVERTDDSSGNLLYWTITHRDFSLVVESLTTNFWYNQDMQIVDPITQNPVVDMIRILKSNLVDPTDPTKGSIGSDQIYNVVSDVKFNDGLTNFQALSITPSNIFTTIDTSTTNTSQDPLEFLSFVGSDNYVYFSIDRTNGNLIPIAVSDYLASLTYINGVTSDNSYARKLGRDDLDFMWQHFTPDDNLIDPSVSNIIDIYVLTSGYYSQIQEYINGIIPIEPTPPSPLDLRNSYSTLLQNKMISDTAIMHSGLVKFLFGALAIPELRVTFRVVLSPTATLTGDQVRASVLNVINQYFVIDNWNFGQSFYATELCAVIHQQLSTQILSVVMVPQFPTNYFGDLFYLQSASNEVFVSCATIDNIEIVSSIDRLTLKQKQ